VLFPHGYGQITRHLAAGLTIKLEHLVQRIDWSGKPGVAVETSQGAYRARFVVVTLPLGVLKRGNVAFAPALPAEKQAAIDRVGMGLLNKTYLRFPHQFWPAKPDWLGMVSTPKGRWAEYINVSRFVPQPILLGFNAATYARRVERLTDEQTIAGMVAALRSMFGRNKVPDPTHAAVTRWGSDPFSFGSYSFLKTGAMPRDHDLLAEPVGGRLYFAGEHTSRRYAATVHGAYLSGLHAARLVAAEA
jgi:monoamine oxidase